jgi:glutamate/tyrosine decarboxylase-like PLP-dependent enzyme
VTTDPFIDALPEQGIEPAELERLLAEGAGGDVDWRRGRGWSLVYDSPAWHQELVYGAVARFAHENALSHAAFPSAARFESSVIAMAASVMSPGVRAYGVFASGGTEATMIAVKAYRDRARHEAANIVIPVTAHPAFRKAAAYLGLEVVSVPVGPDGVPAVDELLAAIDEHTVVVGLSAPCYPYGVVDPIVEVAAGAAERGVGVHVDAAMGGLFLPFLDAAGAVPPRFGIDVPGVTSVAVDLHKYGYSAKGASVLLFADPALRHAAYHTYIGWPGGAYAASGVLGTRSVAAAAGAFTAMAALGRRGYEMLTDDVMTTTRRLQSGLADAAGLAPVGHPPMSVFAATSARLPIGALAGVLSAKGWWIDAQSPPPSIHFTVFPRHAAVVDAFVDDVRAAAEHLSEPGTSAESALPSSYGVMVRGNDSLTEEALFADLDARFDGPGET